MSELSEATVSRVMAAVALTTFVAGLTIRSIDPVLPQIADSFILSIQSAATLSSGFAITYACVQPVMGMAADLFGKTRLMTVCLGVLVVGVLLGSLSPTFSTLFASRIVCGAMAGGIFPVALAVAGDLVPVKGRQVAIGRLIGSAMAGNLLGATVSGLIGDYSSWRFVLVAFAVPVLVAFVIALFVFREVPPPPKKKLDARTIFDGYKSVFSNPNARVCFSAVAIEGLLIFGLFPFVATMLAGWGETRFRIAGIVIAGFGCGGVVYSFLVSHLLAFFKQRGMMIAGGIVMAIQLVLVSFGPPWPVQVALFLCLGVGFFMLHGSIQLFATELAPQARTSGVALHAFSFFVGQAFGPVVYGFGVAHLGVGITLPLAAVAICALGFACAALLRHPQPAPQ